MLKIPLKNKPIIWNIIKMEEWKEYLDVYEISNIGNVRRKLKSGEIKILKCSTNHGYKYFQTQMNKKKN